MVVLVGFGLGVVLSWCCVLEFFDFILVLSSKYFIRVLDGGGYVEILRLISFENFERKRMGFLMMEKYELDLGWDLL